MTEELAPDDIRIGDWFVIVGSSMINPEENPYVKIQFVPDGVPWNVRAVSLPFIIATDGTRYMTFYLPLFKLRRVTKRYVTEYIENVAPQGRQCRHG